MKLKNTQNLLNFTPAQKNKLCRLIIYLYGIYE